MPAEATLRTLASGLEAGEQIDRLSGLVEALTGLVGERGGEPIAYDAKGLSEVLPISGQVISGLISAGVFPSVNIGRRRLVLREDVINTLREMQRIEKSEYVSPGSRHTEWAHDLAALLQSRREGKVA